MSSDASVQDLLIVAVWALCIGIVFVVVVREWFN